VKNEEMHGRTRPPPENIPREASRNSEGDQGRESYRRKKKKVVEEKGIARLSLGHPGHRLLRRGNGLTRSRASRFSSCSSAPEAGSIPVFMVMTENRKVVEEKGIEPSTPTLRTWCSPS
jgi:hypothetical protein